MVAIAKNTRSHLSVTDLVRAAQSGDRQSLAELFFRYQHAIEKTLRKRLANPSDVRDVGQDVSIQAATSLDRLRNPERFGGWVQTIARRLASRRNARLVRDHSVDPHSPTGNPACESVSPIEQLIQQEQNEALHAALSSLKPSERQVLEWFYFDEQSIRQISELARIPVGTVKSRLHTARRRLGVRLGRRLTA